MTRSKIHGYKMLQRLRNAQVDTPILILSGLGELDQRVKVLRFGADDVLTKPFDGGELLARIQAIVRRSNGHSQSMIRTGRLVVNLAFELVVELPIRGLSLAALVELAAHRLADAKQPFRVRFDQCSGPGGVVFAS